MTVFVNDGGILQIMSSWETSGGIGELPKRGQLKNKFKSARANRSWNSEANFANMVENSVIIRRS
jgi:hypothetical protein